MAASVTEPAAAAGQPPLRVIGRLLSSRGPGTPEERLELLGRLMRHGGGWWRAEDIAAAGESLPELRDGLRALRRAGMLEWDERAQAYALAERMRVPAALLLLACDPDACESSEQIRQLDALIPFAQAGPRSSGSAAAPAWAILDVLERDSKALERAQGSAQGVEEAARERWLADSAAGMAGAAGRLAELAGDGPLDPALAARAVELISRVGGLVAALSQQMSRASRDLLRLPGSRRAPSELRAAAAGMDDAELAELAAAAGASAPACVHALAPEGQLALAGASGLPADAASREFPALADLAASPPPAPEAREPDSRAAAARRLQAATRPRTMARELFEPIDSWGDALALQSGLARLHDQRSRAGQPGWAALPEMVSLGAGAAGRAREIESAGA